MTRLPLALARGAAEVDGLLERHPHRRAEAFGEYGFSGARLFPARQ